MQGGARARPATGRRLPVGARILAVVLLALAGGCWYPAGSAAPVKIMIVGSSVSQGHEGDYTWRYRLWQHLRSSGANARFVGPWTGTNALPDALPEGYPQIPTPPVYDGRYRPGIDFPSRHHARWGLQMHQAKNIISSAVGTYRPNYLLVEVGVNDLNWAVSDPAQLLADARSFIAQARTAKPDIRILIANVVHRARTDLPAIDEYNAGLAAAVNALTTPTSPVALVDLDERYDATVDSYDGLHPNGIGEFKIAAAFADTLHTRFAVGRGFPAIPGSVPDLRPPAPSGVTATPAASGIDVAWTHCFGASGYWVYRRDATVGGEFERSFFPIAARSWRVTGLAPGHRYEFTVTAARGDYESARSPAAGATAGQVPAPAPARALVGAR